MNNWSGELQGIIVTFCFNQFPSGVGESALKGKRQWQWMRRKARDRESSQWWKWALGPQSLRWHLPELETRLIQTQNGFFSLSPSHSVCFLSNSCYATVMSLFHSQPMDPYNFKIISFVHFHFPHSFLKKSISQLQYCPFMEQKKNTVTIIHHSDHHLCFQESLNSFCSQIG